MEFEYTWQTLGTMTGCSAAVLLVTQYIKDYTPKWLHTRLLVLALSFVFLLAAWALGQTEHVWTDVLLILVNSFVVALAAMGAYETALKGAGTEASETGQTNDEDTDA